MGAPADPAAGQPFDRSMFGEGLDMGGSGLELDNGSAPTPPGVPPVAPGQPPAASGSFSPPSFGDPGFGQVPAEAPTSFDTSSFAPGPPVQQGPPPEAYQRFDEAYFAQNHRMLPEATTIHGSRQRRQQNADDFFSVDSSQNQNS